MDPQKWQKFYIACTWIVTEGRSPVTKPGFWIIAGVRAFKRGDERGPKLLKEGVLG